MDRGAAVAVQRMTSGAGRVKDHGNRGGGSYSDAVFSKIENGITALRNNGNALGITEDRARKIHIATCNTPDITNTPLESDIEARETHMLKPCSMCEILLCIHVKQCG